MIKRGDIYYVTKSPSAMSVGSEIYAARPAVIVSDERLLNAFETVSVVYLTTSPKVDMVTHVKINCNGRKSIALCEQINTVSTNRLGEKMGECTEQELTAVGHGLMRALNLDESDGELITNIDEDEVRRAVDERTQDLIGENNRMSKALSEAQRDIEFYKGLYETLRERYM